MLEVVGNSQTLLLGNVLLDPLPVQLQIAINLQNIRIVSISIRYWLHQVVQDFSK